eukprot:7383371-Prymnesium_polylepis.1
MSVTQVLGVGDSTVIDHNDAFVEFDVLGQQIVLAPSAATVGILAAMRGTLANLQPVSGVATSAIPYVVSVSSDYAGAVASVVASPSCSSHSLGLSGCVSTTASLATTNATVDVSAGGFSRTVYLKTYAPNSVVLELSHSVLGQ